KDLREKMNALAKRRIQELDKNQLESTWHRLSGLVNMLSKDQLELIDIAWLKQNHFDSLFPKKDWPEFSRIKELKQEQVYDCLELFDADRMFLLSDDQVKAFDFTRKEFQNLNPKRKKELIDGLFRKPQGNVYEDRDRAEKLAKRIQLI